MDETESIEEARKRSIAFKGLTTKGRPSSTARVPRHSKISFWLGASLLSCLWFFGLSYLSSQLNLLRLRPDFLEKISKASGFLLIIFAVKMAALSFL